MSVGAPTGAIKLAMSIGGTIFFLLFDYLFYVYR